MDNKLLDICFQLLKIIEKMKIYSFSNYKMDINTKHEIIDEIIDLKDDLKIYTNSKK